MNEIAILALVALFTALMWMPYILERIYQQGLIATVGYPEQPPKISPWAERAQKAHKNAVENLAVFAALVFAVHVSSAQSDTTLLAAQIYLIARVAHYICYLLAVPWLRTLAFFGGFVAQSILAIAVLG